MPNYSKKVRVTRTARATARAILADVRKVRAAGLEVPAVCAALLANVRALRAEMSEALQRLADLKGAQVTR
jgi:hypothetical protein